MKKILTASGIAVCLVLAACGGSAAQQDIARQFWDAMKSQDIATAQSFAKSGSMTGVTANRNAAVESVNLLEVRMEGDKAMVPTQMVGTRDGKREQLSFETVLEQEEGAWKVNFDETMNSMMGLYSPGGMGKAGMGGMNP